MYNISRFRPEVRTYQILNSQWSSPRVVMDVYIAFSVAALLLFVLVLIAKIFKSRGTVPGDYPRDTVILHQIIRGPYAPSISPFCVKLETYLRMADIKYQSVSSRAMSTKGKIPWIEFNGEVVADSQFCIQFLQKKFDVNLNRGLKSDDLAIAAAFQRLSEDSLYWCIVLYRWVYRVNSAWLQETKMPAIVRWFVCRGSRKQTWAQGMGRHSQPEVDEILRNDLKALSDFLGSKPFLMGNEATEVDCAVFGQLSQFKWNMWGSLANKLIKDEFTNLDRYCERMKERYWPDWDELTLKGQKKT